MLPIHPLAERNLVEQLPRIGPLMKLLGVCQKAIKGVRGLEEIDAVLGCPIVLVSPRVILDVCIIYTCSPPPCLS